MIQFSFDIQRFEDSVNTIIADDSKEAVYGTGTGDYIDVTEDYVSAVQYKTFSIYGGAGDDTINLIAEDLGEGNSWAALYNATVGVSGEGGNDFIKTAAKNGSALYDDTFLELNGGTGNDTITIEGGPNHGVIYDSTLKADGGDDNDIIGINGFDAINGNSYVTVAGGKGADTINITGSHYAVTASEVSINGGEDADVIAITSINENAKVTVSAGYNDTVTVSSGKAVYVFDSTNAVYINKEIFTSKVADTYAELQTADSSVSLGNEWSGNVIIFEDNTFTDIEGTTVEDAGQYTIVDGKIVTVDSDTTVSDTDTASSDTVTPDTQRGGDLYVDIHAQGNVVFITGDDNTINGGVGNSVTIMSYNYDGGYKVINNYQQGEVVQLNSDYRGIDLSGNSFFVNSSSGKLEIQNARDKFIGYGAGNTNVIAWSYVASNSNDVDGRSKSGAVEIMIGADNSNNKMYANNAGSSMWGGNGGADSMFGGDGYDEFFYAVGSGNDVIKSSTSLDMINILGVSLEQISAIDVTIGEVNINFVDGGNLKVEGNTGVGYKLGDAVYTVNQYTGEWSAK